MTQLLSASVDPNHSNSASTNRVRRLIPLLAALALLFGLRATPLRAQESAGEEQGLKPYGTFHGGDIDQVSMVNGKLTLNIPLVSYPQRGGKLHAGFSLIYHNPSYEMLDVWQSDTKPYYWQGTYSYLYVDRIYHYNTAIDVATDFNVQPTCAVYYTG